jgi:hypothetical protein
MEAIDPVCFRCKHWKKFIGGCNAFPDGIPFEITSGLNEHSEPLPEQDNKIVFEPIEE